MLTKYFLNTIPGTEDLGNKSQISPRRTIDSCPVLNGTVVAFLNSLRACLFMRDVIISDHASFEKKKRQIKETGINNFHIVSDFDRTLTKVFVKGQKQSTAIAQIREGGYLSPDYVEKAYALYDKYRPIEIDESISKKERSKKMVEWWSTHLGLIVESGMSKAIVEDIVKKGRINPREGLTEFFEFINFNEVPILILSAAVGNIIEEFLRENKMYAKNVHIISNFFDYDSDGKVTGYKSQIIHTFNKNEVQIEDYQYAKEIEKRKNILLIGDTLGDLNMLQGVSHEVVLRVGFLNENVDENFDLFKKEYDIVILGDGSMEPINQLLRELFE